MRIPSGSVFLVVLLLALQVGGWWWAGRLQPAGPDVAGGRLQALSFAPYRSGQSPFTGAFPSAAEVEEDVARLVPYAHTLRTYAAIEGDYEVAAIAGRHGLKLWQGIWIGGDAAQNAREIARAIEVAGRHPTTVERVVVGNEVLLRRDLSPEALIAAIGQVRAGVRQPVTYADVWEFWERYPQVAAHVDIVTIHLLPYWEDDPVAVDRAVAHVGATWKRIAALFPGKPVAIGEAGWPSRGRWRADAAPGLVAQQRFVRGVLALAAREGFEINLIEAFDQEWKIGTEGTVGPSWGLWSAGRVLKAPLAGPVSNVPDWPWRAATGIGLGLLLWRVRPGAAALVAGALLGWAGWALVPVAWGWDLALATGVGLAGQAVLAALLLRDAAWRPIVMSAFLWAAAVVQVLLMADSRYRDFPLPYFVVPVLGVLLGQGAQARRDALPAGVLAVLAVTSWLQEGAENLQAGVWMLAALVLAAPALARFIERR